MAWVPRQRKMFSADPDVLDALADYAQQSGVNLNDLHDEALRDLLKKKGQPATLKEAFERSARPVAANDRARARRKSAKRRKTKD